MGKGLCAMVLSGAAALLCVICGCKGSREPSEVAAQVAKQYYEQLIAGDYASFVDGLWQSDSIDADYRSQLIANMKKFVGEQGKLHKGIRDISIERAEADTARHTADVFLRFGYGDDSSEPVLVPMTEHNGTWYLR